MSEQPVWHMVRLKLPVQIRVLAEGPQEARRIVSRLSFRAIGVPSNEYSVGFPEEMDVEEPGDVPV